MRPKKAAAGPSKKRPYRVPELTVHGDLRKLTKVKAGTMVDAGKPPTRASGTAG